MKKKKNTGPSTTTTDAPETGALESDIASPREASESTEPIGLRPKDWRRIMMSNLAGRKR